jgi:type VI secretion system protein ImpC
MDVFRWVIAGRFSSAPSGELFRTSESEWVELLGRRCGAIHARVPDRIGSADFREVSLDVKSMRAFSVPGVIDSSPELKALRAMSDRPPPTRDQALAEIERIAGRGRLWDACSTAGRAATAPSTVLDDVLQVARTHRKDAARAVDAFVAASRGAGTATPARSDPELEKVGAAVSECILATALDVLRSEAVAALEANWRGLRMLLERCGSEGGLRVDVLDVARDGIVAAARALPRSDEFDDPDALFAVDEIASLAVLRELSELASETTTPCIAAVSPRVLAAESTDELVHLTEQGGPIDPAWDELRASETSRWLCATLNGLILHAEQAGATQRIVSGSSAWAVATMLAASWKTQGSFAHVLGRRGAISGPAVWTPPGRVRSMAIPTESFLSIAPQKELARWGVLAVGSQRDSDRIVLGAAPMVSSARGAYPLPAQMLAGRIVRYARWVRNQVTPAMDAGTVSALYEQGAGVFLFPGLPPAAAMLKVVVSGDGPERKVHVKAAASPGHALVPFELELSLPL